MRALLALVLLAGCSDKYTVFTEVPDDTGPANRPPSAPTVSISPAAPTTLDDLVMVVDVAAEDPDGDVVSYRIAWTRDGEVRDDVGGDTVPAALTGRGEAWRVTVVPTDGLLDGPPGEATVVVGNSAPTMVSVTLSPGDADVRSTLSAAVVGDDLDADPVTIGLRWLVDDAVVQEGELTELAPGPFRSGQQVVVEATPFDGIELGVPMRSAPLTIANTPPALTGATLGPEPAYEASTLTCAGEGWSDEDGDAEGLSFAWTVDGAPISPTDATLDGAWFDKGQVVACVVTPYDGVDAGAPVTSNPVGISNTPPVATGLSVLPTNPTVQDTLSGSVAGTTDADGDTVSLAWSWSVGGTVQSTTDSLDASAYRRGDVVQIEVTPHDGAEPGAPLTTSVTLGNSPPQVLSVSILPASPTTDDVLNAPVSTFDADGDPVSISWAWTVNGVSAGTAASLDGATAFSRGDSVQVRATPSDGVNTGSPVTSAAVTVLNSPPTAPVVAIDPSSPADGDDLICDVAVDSVDADGDSLSYSFAWTRDGVAWTGAQGTTFHTGDTIAASATTPGQLWTCEVTPSDGTDTGPSATDSAEIRLPCTRVKVAMMPGWGSLTNSSLSWRQIDTNWTSYGTCEVQMVEVGHGYTLSSLNSLNAQVLLFVDPAGGNEFITSAENSALRAWLNQGGQRGVVMTFLVHGANTDNSHVFDLVGIDRARAGTSAMSSMSAASVLDPSHTLSARLPTSGTFNVTSYTPVQSFTSGDIEAALLSGAEYVIQASDGRNGVIAYDNGVWRGVYFPGMPGYQTTTSSWAQARQAMYNSVIWAAGY